MAAAAARMLAVLAAVCAGVPVTPPAANPWLVSAWSTAYTTIIIIIIMFTIITIIIIIVVVVCDLVESGGCARSSGPSPAMS